MTSREFLIHLALITIGGPALLYLGALLRFAT